MKIEGKLTRLFCIFLVAVMMFAFGPRAAAKGLKRGKIIYSFAPTPLFRGMAKTGAVMGHAQVMFNSRSYLQKTGDAASVEMAIDVIAVDATTGTKLGDFCVQRTVAMQVPLDLKRMDIDVTDTGVRFTWPDGTVTDAPLYLPGANVEVSILAFALRGDGNHVADVQKASMRVSADLNGDGVLEFNAFTNASHQRTKFFTS